MGERRSQVGGHSLTRIFVAGLLGGLAMMAMNFALHRPPLDAIGWSNMSNEPGIRTALANSFGVHPALFVYPAIASGASAQAAAVAKYDAAAKAGPSGILLYRPAGGDVDPAGSVIRELGKTLLVSVMAAMLMAKASPGMRYVGRVAFVAAIGGIASLSTNWSYHAWFGFPLDYTLARIIMEFGGWTACSLVIAALLPYRSSPTAA